MVQPWSLEPSGSVLFHVQVHLYEGWDIRSLVQSRRKEKLQRHLEYVFASDWLIHLEGGVKRLSYSELVAVSVDIHTIIIRSK